MKSIKKDARIAGLLYLITVVSGIISLVYVPSKLIFWENPSETYNTIVSNVSLFKMGVLSDLVLYTTFIFLSLALYKLLRKTNENVARTMVILVLLSVSISYVNLINKFDVLSLISGSEVFNPQGLNLQYSKMMTLLESHNNGILVVEIFWGLWLFPFGYLVYKSGIIPKIMGVFLMMACFGYLADFFGYFLFPENYGKTVIPILQVSLRLWAKWEFASGY